MKMGLIRPGNLLPILACPLYVLLTVHGQVSLLLILLVCGNVVPVGGTICHITFRKLPGETHPHLVISEILWPHCLGITIGLPRPLFLPISPTFSMIDYKNWLFVHCLIYPDHNMWTCKAGHTPQDNWVWATFCPAKCPNYLGDSTDNLSKFSCDVRCVKSDWICLEKHLRCSDHENIQHVKFIQWEIPMCGGTPRTNMYTNRRLSCEMQYPIRKKAEDGSITNTVMMQHKVKWIGQQRWKIS